jgi:tellurite resistance protein
MTRSVAAVAEHGSSSLALDPQEALVCTMVLVAASSGGISDREIDAMSALVRTLPVFEGFSNERLRVATDAAVALLREEEGLRHASRLVRDALAPRLRETAYALACEVVAADRMAAQDVLRMLEFVREELIIDPLIAAAIERGARARYRTA